VLTSSAASLTAGEGCKKLDVETRLRQLEDRWQQLNSLPTNSEMFIRLRKFRQAEENVIPPDESNVSAKMQETSVTSDPNQQGLRRTGQPMSELWHSMQLLSQVETNTEGITRVRTS